MISSEEIQTLIQKALPGAEVGIQDMTGTGDHYQVLVVSAAFEGKTLLQQHQLVFNALRAALADKLHAVQLKTYTPQQWEKA